MRPTFIPFLRHRDRPSAGPSAGPSAPKAWGEDEIRREWEALLEAATLGCERDEINDFFGRALK